MCVPKKLEDPLLIDETRTKLFTHRPESRIANKQHRKKILIQYNEGLCKTKQFPTGMFWADLKKPMIVWTSEMIHKVPSISENMWFVVLQNFLLERVRSSVSTSGTWTTEMKVALSDSLKCRFLSSIQRMLLMLSWEGSLESALNKSQTILIPLKVSKLSV